VAVVRGAGVSYVDASKAPIFSREVASLDPHGQFCWGLDKQDKQPAAGVRSTQPPSRQSRILGVAACSRWVISQFHSPDGGTGETTLDFTDSRSGAELLRRARRHAEIIVTV